MLYFHSLTVLAVVTGVVASQKLLVTNDDGWAVAIIRAQVDALDEAGYDVRCL